MEQNSGGKRMNNEGKMHAALIRADADYHGSVLVTQRQQMRCTMHEGNASSHF
jgi:hypothetical protein